MTEVIEKTEYKKGYKKTKLGWIPADWEVVLAGDISSVVTGGTPSKVKPEYWNNGNINWMNSSEVNKKYIYEVENKITKIGLDNSNTKILPINTIMIALNGQGKTRGIVAILKIESCCNQSLAGFICKEGTNYQFLFFFLQNMYDDLRNITGDGSRTGLNLNILRKLKIILPPLKEQEKIAEILSAWDDGIETLEKLIEQKEILKKATMQKLFFEKESWQMMRFDKIFKDFCKKNCPRERLLSATQENGVIPRDMLSGKVMSPDGSLDGYKLIEAGDFVISLRSFQGGLEYSKYRGILSPAYTVLKNIIDIDKDFYRYFFKSYKFIEKYLSISVIGIRDGKQISYSDLSSVKIPYPPLEEQEKIGKILNCYDEELQLLNSKLEKLKEQKKGLMQKLLTGQIRIKI